MDHDRYVSEGTRICHILVTTEVHIATLNDDHKIKNLASTIINLTSEYENTTTIICTMCSQHPRNQFTTTNERYPPCKPFQRNRTTNTASRIQCHAYKMFRHTVLKCNM